MEEIKKRGRPVLSNIDDYVVPVQDEVREPVVPKVDNDIAELREMIKEQAKTIDILKDSVSRNKLDQATKEHDTSEKFNTGFFKKLKGKVVVKWLGLNVPGSEAKQEIVYNNNTPVGEKMIGHYIAIDGTKMVCDMLEFVRSTEREEFDIIKKDGEDLIVRFHNPELPQSYETNVKFINP